MALERVFDECIASSLFAYIVECKLVQGGRETECPVGVNAPPPIYVLFVSDDQRELQKSRAVSCTLCNLAEKNMPL